MKFSSRAFRIAMIFFGVLLIVIPLSVNASRAMPRKFSIKTYPSPSGDFEITINPSMEYGSGEGTYTLEYKGETVWEKIFPVTLRDAYINDDGVTVGYSQTRYYGDRRPHRAGEEDLYELWFVIIDASGKIVFTEKESETFPEFVSFHEGEYPYARKMIINSIENIAAFHIVRRVEYTYNEILFINFESKTIESKLAFTKEEGKYFGHIEDIEYIKGTPLIGIIWRTRIAVDDEPSRVVSANSSDGREWFRWFPEDPPRTYKLAIESEKANTFSINDHESVRHDFTLELKDEKWVYEEVGKTKIEEPEDVKDEDKLAGLPVVSITPYQRIHLNDGIEKGDGVKIGYIRCFDYENNVVTVEMKDNVLEVTKVSTDNKVLKTQKISVESFDDIRDLNWLENNKFVLTGKVGENEDGKPLRKLAIFDFEEGKMLPLIDDSIWGLSEISTNQNGYILVKSGRSSDFNSGNEYRIYKSNGEHVSTTSLNQIHGNCGSCRDDGICLTTKNEIAVLHKPLVMFSDFEGHRQHMINLEELWDYKPNYLSGLQAGLDGGVFVRDFKGKYPLVWMSRDGEVIDQFGYSGTMDPSANLWIHDQESIQQLAKDGSVVKLVGREHQSNSIGQVSSAVIDQSGNTYLMSNHSGVVHRFDETGKITQRFVSEAEGIEFINQSQQSLFVGENGTVMTSFHTMSVKKDVPSITSSSLFSQDGSLTKNMVVENDDTVVSLFRFRALPYMFDGLVWQTGLDGINRLEMDGTVSSTMKRDGHQVWNGQGTRVLTNAKGDLLIQNKDYLSVVNRNGDLIKKFNGNSPQIDPYSLRKSVWDGDFIYSIIDEKLYMADEKGEMLFQLKIENMDMKNVQIFCTKQDSELWIFDGDRNIQSYRIADIGI